MSPSLYAVHHGNREPSLPGKIVLAHLVARARRFQYGGREDHHRVLAQIFCCQATV
jgi:hypothetical protein